MSTLSFPAGLQSNPIVNPPVLPFDVPPLDIIRPEHFMPALAYGQTRMMAEIDAIRDNPDAPTFENTIEALAFAGVLQSRTRQIFEIFMGSNITEALQEIAPDFRIQAVSVDNRIYTEPALFARVEAVYNARDALPPQEKRLVEQTYEGFVASGAKLDPEKRAEFSRITERLAELSTLFGSNVVDAENAYEKWVDDEADLAGLSEGTKDGFREAAEEAGQPGRFLIKLSGDVASIMTHAENEELRREIHLAIPSPGFGGAHDNRPLVLEIAHLRLKQAQMLGYPDYAHMAIEGNMIQTPDAAMKMLTRNADAYRQQTQVQLEKIWDFAVSEGHLVLNPWDVKFYERKMKERDLNFDPESIKPYFSLEKVMEGLNHHVENLFNITLQETRGKYPVYHDDVKVFEVRDNATKDIIGVMYTDYYARSGNKSAGAFALPFRDRGLEDGDMKIPLVINTADFTKPTKNQPSLLSLEEIQTVFHEFGHALHVLLSQTKYPSQAGLAAVIDFVELPSQVQERWAETREVLGSFAAHYQTGEKLPAELLEKTLAGSSFDKELLNFRYTFGALLDLEWHSIKDEKTFDGLTVEAFEDAVREKYKFYKRDGGGARSTWFTHIFELEYGAQYYGYELSAILDADVFAPFRQKGLYDPALARDLRQHIYEPGDSVDAMELYKRMMKREPDYDVLLRQQGLLGRNDNRPGASAPDQKAGASAPDQKPGAA